MSVVLTQKMLKGYELRERIGAGGFGAVYRAYQSTVGREVAIKIILPGLANLPEFIRRFEIEAQLIARLEHPHITPLYDYWRDADGAYLVMRWLRGGSVRDALQNGPFELRAIALLLDQIAGALALAHRSGVIHRDIKPGNILLDEDGNAYLTDFGIAKDLNLSDSNTQQDAIVGSLDYISPEQARSQPVTARTDIYSLGVTVYELITGEHPFENVSSVERLYKHINDPLPLIMTLPADIRASVNTVIQKATAKNPDARYTDALAFAADFREAARLTSTTSSVVEVLTRREQEILQLIIDGLSNKEIAQQLTVTVGTVKWYVNQIFAKLGVRSRVQAIVRARELHLITQGTAEQPLEVTVVPGSSMGFTADNPYKGLRAFQSADYQDFFGREAVTSKLLKRLAENGDYGRFLAVVGPSGSGKSSLVRAGLIPALWRGDLPGAERWFIADLLPGARPLDELEIALTRIAANQSGNLHEHLKRDRFGLLRVANLILPGDGGDLLLVIDQFEEVFTLVEDEAQRAHFLDLLYTAVTEPRSRVRVVVTLRADFYDRPLHYPQFGEMVRTRLETIMPLSAEELERAIARPAQRVGVTFEPGLVSAIIGDVSYQPGALPLLQYALTELFEGRQGRVLTREAYQAIGGAGGALAKRAEELYCELTPQGQEAARQMFLRLVTLGEGSEDTRRRAARSELLAVAAGEELMDEIIDTYAEYRLLSLDNDPDTRTPTVEVAHEALLREWERLRAWLNESRLDIRTQRQLSALAMEWQTAKRDPSFLARGSRLEQFQAWAASTDLAITAVERAFLVASSAQQLQQQDEERERQARELALAQQAAAAARKAADRLRYLVSALTVFLVVAVVLGGLVFASERRTEAALMAAEREAAVSHSLALDANAREAWTRGDQSLGLALAVEANSVPGAPPEVRRTLADMAYAPGQRGSIGAHEAFITQVAFSPDGRYLLTGGGRGDPRLPVAEDNSLRLWDLQTGAEVRHMVGHTDTIYSLAISPDGRTAVSSAWDSGTIFRWDLQTGAIICRLEGHAAQSLATPVLSPDGAWVLSYADDNTVRLWDLATCTQRQQLDNLLVVHAYFSLDSSSILLVRADENYTPREWIRWDFAAGTTSTEFMLNLIDAIYVAVSPDRNTAALADQSGLVLLLDTATGAERGRLEGHNALLHGLAFSPDSRSLLTAGQDNTLRLWDVISGQQLQRWGVGLQYIGMAGIGMAISPDGRMAAVVPTGASTVQLWDLTSGLEIRRFSAPDVNGFWGLAVSPDGRYVLAGAGMRGLTGAQSWNGNTDIIVWDTQTGQEVRRLPGHTNPPQALVFNPDGSRLLTVGCCSSFAGRYDATIRQWDWTTAVEVRSFWYGDGDLAWGDFSPDGRTALLNTWTNLRLVDVETGAVIRYFVGHELTIWGVRFTPDGRRAISSSLDGTVRVWDIESGAELHRLTLPAGALSGPILSPDGQTVLIVTGDNHVRAFAVETLTELRQFEVGEALWSMTLSPDGRLLLTGLRSGSMILWDFATGEQLARYAGHTEAVGVVFAPDGQTFFSASWDGTVREWAISRRAPDELIAWTYANRSVRELTESERAVYRLDALSAPGQPLPTRTPFSIGATATPPAIGSSTPAQSTAAALPVPTITPMMLPTATPVTHGAVVGDNRGSLALDGIDWWSYAGQQGEVLTLSANADYPPDDNLFPLQRIERGQLDTTLRVLGPDGVVLRQNADTFESENAQIRDLALPTSGMYIIEVRPEKYLMQGAYTLVIDSTLP